MATERAVFTLGHSPDPDDAFMFYAMAENKIDLRGHRFEHRLEDIQTLNERALRGEHGRWVRANSCQKKPKAQYPNPKPKSACRSSRLVARLCDRCPGTYDKC